MKTNKERNRQAYGMLIAAACFLPFLAIQWLDYFRASDIIITIFTVISMITCPLGILIFIVFSDRVYNNILEDKKNNVDFRQVKLKDLFYRYIPADIVKIVLSFAFIGIGLAIVYNTDETDTIVQIFGSTVFFETCVLGSLGIAFYTLWAFYCNYFSSKQGRIKYIIVSILIIAAMVLIGFAP